LSARAQTLRGFGSGDLAIVAILAFNFGSVFLSRNAIGLVGPFLAPQVSLSNTQLGALSAAVSLAWGATGFIGTVFAARRYEARTVLVVLSALNALSLFWTAAAASFASALASRLLAGAASGPVIPLSQAWVARRSVAANRGARMGALQGLGGSLIGGFVAPALLVPVATLYGSRAAFATAGAFCGLAALLLWRGARSFATAAGEGAVPAVKDDDGPARSPKNLRLCCLVSALMVGWLIITITFLPGFALHSLHWSAARMAVAMSGFGVMSLLSTVAVPALSDRFGRRAALSACAGIGALAALGVWGAGGGMAAFVAVIAVGIAGGTFPLFMAAIPAESARRSQVATWIGIVQGVGEVLGGVIAPLLAGVAADRFGPPAALSIATLCVCSAAIVTLFFRETHPAARGR
jgi:MFS family permease